MYQLIKKVLSNPDDNTKLHLFYANKTEKDILLYRELAILANSNPHKFQLHLSVDTPQEDWKGSSGLISPSTFGEIPRTEVGILVCGSDGFINAVAGKKELRGQGPLGGILGLLGYQPSQVYKF
jgi:cytochrome-b5 reductase